MDQRNNADDDRRPDPDALLKEIEREDEKRGRLKIFLGYAPGVGKTYAMLQEAHILKNRGVDIVIGIVETHKRAETQSLLADIENVPRRQIEYEGMVLEEMDLDAVLARRPDAVLVDELAHTNPPDARHPKRYQDVEELLASGIDVYTTVNIQHFSSQTDVVSQITGIKVQETVPDSLLDRADEVQVIDIPLEELFQRLKEGKVYIPEQARRAVRNFFQRGNLVALRELTLTLVARKMDTELLNYMKSRAISGPWPAGERIMVCIAPNPYAPQLLRRAYKIARDAHAELYAVYVSTPAVTDLSDREKGNLTEALNLAEEMGAKVVTLTGKDIAEELLRFATERNITRIVIGKPLRSTLQNFWRSSPVHQLMHARTDFELHLVTPTLEDQKPQHRQASGKLSFDMREYGMTVAMVAAVTALNFVLESLVDTRSLVFIYLIATIASALFFGTIPSIVASAISLLTFDFFFVEPRYSFTMLHSYDVVNVVIFLLTSIVVGQLVKTTRLQNIALQVRLSRISLIEEMSKEFMTLPPVEQLVGNFVETSPQWSGALSMLRTTILDEISNVTVKYVERVITEPSFVLLRGDGEKLKVWARSDSESDLTAHEMTVAEWVYNHGEMAGAGTQTLPNVALFFVPMKALEETVGILGVRGEFKALLLDQRRLLSAVSNLSALALARWVNVRL
jgi:two-component system sensor histidine kinase KdpD